MTVYSDNGQIKQLIQPFDDFTTVDAVSLGRLLTAAVIHVINYYPTGINKESEGEMDHGNKIGIWKYYWDNETNSVRARVDH